VCVVCLVAFVALAWPLETTPVAPAVPAAAATSAITATTIAGDGSLFSDGLNIPPPSVGDGELLVLGLILTPDGRPVSMLTN
jgi:hypothetical protein